MNATKSIISLLRFSYDNDLVIFGDLIWWKTCQIVHSCDLMTRTKDLWRQHCIWLIDSLFPGIKIGFYQKLVKLHDTSATVISLHSALEVQEVGKKCNLTLAMSPRSCHNNEYLFILLLTDVLELRDLVKYLTNGPEWQTDRKRRIWANRTICTGGLN